MIRMYIYIYMHIMNVFFNEVYVCTIVYVIMIYLYMLMYVYTYIYIYTHICAYVYDWRDLLTHIYIYIDMGLIKCMYVIHVCDYTYV